MAIATLPTHLQRRLFTVKEYACMVTAGILKEEDRVELLDGEVRVMSPIGPLHSAIVARLTRTLVLLCADTAIVRVQSTIQLNDYTEPQPDLAVLRDRSDFYATGHPVAADVLLVIEVADTSLQYDREEKLPCYATAGIPEAWLINIPQQVVEQYTQPRNGQYRSKLTLERGDMLRTQNVVHLDLDVDSLFG